MHPQIAWGIAIVILAGTLNGSFAAPMKRMPAWPWENSWLTFASSGLLVFPWIIALATIPHIAVVYAGASHAALMTVFLFGLAWGVGSTLFGIGISRVGLALGFAVILGITASFGSLLPLAVLHPEQLLKTRGLALIAGTTVMVLGLVLLALAGRRREMEQSREDSLLPPASGFMLGLVICIFSGIFSSMLNFSFLFGDELRVRALAAGASPPMAANAIWSLAVFGGFITNVVYCSYLFGKNHTFAAYRKGNVPAYTILGGLMGLLWFGGVMFYGMGAASLGTLGGIVGWPIFMTLDILAGLFWGAVSGEWKGASQRSLAYCWSGVVVLLLAIAVISAGNAA